MSLAAAVGMDLSTALIWVDDRFDYGEARFHALGLIGSRLHAMVFTNRETVLRIISLRKANERERRRFDRRREPGMD